MRINYERDYYLLLKSGMFWEFHPELSGNYEQDKESWITQQKKLNKFRKKFKENKQ
jgi:hypothetical protein